MCFATHVIRASQCLMHIICIHMHVSYFFSAILFSIRRSRLELLDNSKTREIS